MATRAKKRARRQRRGERRKLEAQQLPGTFRAVDGASSASVEAAADENGRPTFDMLAYSGGLLHVAGFPKPVVVDLSGMKIRAQSLPVHRHHPGKDDPHEVGHTTSVRVEDNTIRASGVFSAESPDVGRVVEAARRGFPWVPSIGARVVRVEAVPAGRSVAVNGRTFEGPVLVARESILNEISFVTVGGDAESDATISALMGAEDMKFSQWLAAKGFNADDLDETQLASLQAMYDAEQAASEEDDEHNGKRMQAGVDPDEFVKDLRAKAAAETERQSKIRTICAKYDVSEIDIEGAKVDLAATAIAENWTAEKTELQALRASRPKAPAAHSRNTSLTNDVIEAALCQALALPDVEKQYTDQQLQSAHDMYRGRIGLQQVLLQAAAANGFSLNAGERIHDGNLKNILRAAFPPTVEAAFSTVSLPGILSNVANKKILEGYMSTDQQWRQIARRVPVSDFKQVTSYRLLDNMEYLEVGPTGEIKHGSVGEESYTHQAKTYARMFSLTRTMIINDDLGAFNDIRERLGREASQAFNKIFWAKFLDNSTFFTSARGNYISGATTALDVNGTGLQKGILAFDALASPADDGAKTIDGEAEILLHPPALQFNAARLYQSTTVNTGGSSTNDTVGNDNIHAGKYRPVKVKQLSDSSFTGYSAKAWYLLRNPADLAAIVVSFLNGNETPTVESADADFNVLGVQFRGYHDFGCDLAEYLCGVKSKGEA